MGNQVVQVSAAALEADRTVEFVQGVELPFGDEALELVELGTQRTVGDRFVGEVGVAKVTTAQTADREGEVIRHPLEWVSQHRAGPKQVGKEPAVGDKALGQAEV